MWQVTIDLHPNKICAALHSFLFFFQKKYRTLIRKARVVIGGIVYRKAEAWHQGILRKFSFSQEECFVEYHGATLPLNEMLLPLV
jgi:hypothetical protein